MTTSEVHSLPPASGTYSAVERPPRVLLADDDDELRNLVAEELRYDGYEVLEAKDGAEMELRLKSVRHCPLRAPDVIVMDVRMPGHSGLEILEAIRQAQWTTPVVLITGFLDQKLTVAARELEAVIFAKPFDIDALRVAIRSHRTAA